MATPDVTRNGQLIAQAVGTPFDHARSRQSQFAAYAVGKPAEHALQSRAAQFAAQMVYGPPQTPYVHGGQLATANVYSTGFKRVPHVSQLAIQVVYSDATPAPSKTAAWTFRLDGHIFYVLDLGKEGTFLYDLTTKQWCEFSTKGFYGWNMRAGSVWGPHNRIAGADSVTPTVWQLDPSQRLDDGFRTISHFVTGAVPTRNRTYLAVESVRITGSFGDLGEMGEDVQATFTMRFSDDQGKTWSSDYTLVLVPEDWDGEIAWRSLGSFMAPGRTFEFEDEGGLLRIDGADIFIQDFDNG